jgi:nucleotide-binding universal stress UspA family protein
MAAVHNRDTERQMTAPSRILVGVDFTERGRLAARYAKSTFPGVPLVLCHTLTPLHRVALPAELPLIARALGAGDVGRIPEVRVERALELLREEARYLGLKGARLEVRHGLPADSLLACAREEQCDLVIIGSKGRRSAGSAGTASLVERLARFAQRPLTIVPPGPPVRTEAGESDTGGQG